MLNVFWCFAAIAEHCAPPPRMENAVPKELYQTKYLSGFEMTYRCRYHYAMEESQKVQGTIRCNNGSWTDDNIRCTRMYSKAFEISSDII